MVAPGVLGRGVPNDVLTAADWCQSETYDFVMGCWTPDELRRRLSGAGFELVKLRASDTTCTASTDRLVAIARRRSR